MKWKDTHPRQRLYLIAAITLVVGLSVSTVIYLTAEDVSVNASVYEFEGSKRYLHDLELYGGKVNVLAAEFMSWFKGLWQGRSLAFTLAFITALVSLGIFFVAYTWIDDPAADGRNGNSRDGNG